MALLQHGQLRAVLRASARAAETFAANRTNQPGSAVRLIISGNDMRMAQLRQINSFLTKANKGSGALGFVQNVQLFDGDEGIEFAVATLIHCAERARTQRVEYLVTLGNVVAHFVS